MARSTQEALKEHLERDPVSAAKLDDLATTVAERMDPETGEILANPDDGESFAGESDPVQVIAKVTIATVGGNPSAAKTQQKRVPVCAIYGNAMDVKLVDDPTRKGPDGNAKQWEALAGAFHAVNLQNGMEYMSGVLYLPDAFQSMVLTLVKKQNEERSRRGMAHFKGVEFSYQIDAVPASNPSGYSYVLRSLLPPRKADPLAALRERTLTQIGELAGAQKLLTQAA